MSITRKPRKTTANPCFIHGVLYPSQRAAAEALNVTDARVSQALNAGRVDQLGSGHLRPCVIRGVEYPSRSAAAEALGVTIGRVSQAIREGRTDQLGVGRGGWQGRRKA
jgi:DNA-binding transcriptional LysR family regulator